MKTIFNSVVDGLKRFGRWVRGLLPGNQTESDSLNSGLSLGALRLLLYGLIAVAVVLILVVIRQMWRNAQRVPVGVWTARVVAKAEPDLSDDQLEAAHLPTEGWLALAREQIAKGEWRLALRALYLATLARLAAEGLITLIKSKTNLDYEKELRRRAPANVTLGDAFAARRQEFEAVWYGQANPGEDRIRAWLNEMQGGAPS